MNVPNALYILAKRPYADDRISMFRLCRVDLAARAESALRIETAGLDIVRDPEGWYRAEGDVTLSSHGFQAYVRIGWELRRMPELERPEDGVLDLDAAMRARGYELLARDIVRKGARTPFVQKSWFTPAGYDAQLAAWRSADDAMAREEALYAAMFDRHGQ